MFWNWGILSFLTKTYRHWRYSKDFSINLVDNTERQGATIISCWLNKSCIKSIKITIQNGYHFKKKYVRFKIWWGFALKLFLHTSHITKVKSIAYYEIILWNPVINPIYGVVVIAKCPNSKNNGQRKLMMRKRWKFFFLAQSRVPWYYM